MDDPTKEEQFAVHCLKCVAKRWPNSLWLFSASGTLHVMKKNQNGERVMRDGRVDGNYSIASIKIENDGGDW